MKAIRAVRVRTGRLRSRPSLAESARAATWQGAGPPQAFLEELDRVLAGRTAPRVAVVTGPQGHRLVALLRETFPAADVLEGVWSAGDDELHVRLTAAGPFDLVLDLTRAASPVVRLKALLFHTRPGGALVIRKPGRRRAPKARERLDRFVEELAAARQAGDARPPGPFLVDRDRRPFPEQDFDSVVAALEDLRLGREWLTLVSRWQVEVKIREEQVDRVLALRGAAPRVLERLPATTLASRCEARASEPDWLARFPASYAVPELSVREYADVEVHPGQLVVKDGLILPASFRHCAQARLRNEFFSERGRDFAQVVGDARAEVDGSWYYLDNEHRGHFGHALTEQISQLWGWQAAKAEQPDLKALVSLNRNRPMAGWEYDLLEAGGVSRSDVVMLEEPVRVRRLITAAPMFTMPHYVHPRIAETWSGMGERLAAQAPQDAYPRRIFCSRRIRNRQCHNAHEVEALFAGHGFRVVYPEDHPLWVQVALFRNAEVVAGFSGSGLFQLAFAGGPKHAILLSHTAYTAQNEYMMAAVMGHRLDMVLSQPDLDAPVGRPAYGLDFTFDADREGTFLRGVLGEL